MIDNEQKISSYCEQCENEVKEINEYPCDICRSKFEIDLNLNSNKIIIPHKYKPKNRGIIS